MKKLLSIMLAVLIIVSLGIIIFPANPVEAKNDHGQGIVYHIQAKGPGTCDYYHYTPIWPPREDVDGEFFINFNGSADFYKWGWGWGSWWNDGRGHVKGSFDGHEIDAVLEATWIKYEKPRWDYPDMPVIFNGSAKGFYDGEKALDGWFTLGPIKPDATETIKLSLTLWYSGTDYLFIEIYMDDSADIFKADIDLVGY